MGHGVLKACGGLDMKHDLWKIICNVQETGPLVHNITNYVVMNSTANTLLAIGASPVMAHAEQEVADMVSIASSLVINIGTLSEHWVEAIKLALRQANAMKKPVVLDPVGSGATAYRNSAIEDLLAVGSFSVIRGNASEIMSMVSEEHRTKGVDSMHSADNALDAAHWLNENHGAIVCISGEVDYVVGEEQTALIRNGHEMMTKVTGMGCSATAVIGACIAVEEDAFMATCAAMALMGVVGELVVPNSQGPGSLQVNFLDKLYTITEEEFLDRVRVEIA